MSRFLLRSCLTLLALAAMLMLGFVLGREYELEKFINKIKKELIINQQETTPPDENETGTWI